MIHYCGFNMINTCTEASEQQNAIGGPADVSFREALHMCFVYRTGNTIHRPPRNHQPGFVIGKRQSRIFSICRQELGLLVVDGALIAQVRAERVIYLPEKLSIYRHHGNKCSYTML